MSVKGGEGSSRPLPLKMSQLLSELQQLRNVEFLELDAKLESEPEQKQTQEPKSELSELDKFLATAPVPIQGHRAPQQKQPSYRVPFKAATPRSSHKKSTPLKMRPKPPGIKRTPNSRTPRFKALFTPEKENSHQHHPTSNFSEKSSKREIIFAAPYFKPHNLHNSLNEKTNQDLSSLDALMDKLNLSNNASQISHNQSKISTPQSGHISSNLILKECRENIVTPYKHSHNDKKYETPLQHSNSSYSKARTPLFPMKDVSAFGSHYKPLSKVSSHLFSVKEKENTPLQSEFNNKLFETSNENSLADIQSSSLMKSSNKSSDESSSLTDQIASQKKQRETKVDNSFNDSHMSSQLKFSNKYQDESLSMLNQMMVNDNKLSTHRDTLFGSVIKTSENHKNESQKNETQSLLSCPLQNGISNPKSIGILQMPHIMSPEIFNKPLSCKKPSDNQKITSDNRLNNLSVPANEVHNYNHKSIFATPLNHPKNELVVKNNPKSPKTDLNEILSKNEIIDEKTIEQFKTLTIKEKKYTILGKLGSGGSSEVLKVMDTETSMMYAVKCVNLAVQQSIAESYINEIKLLQRLQGSDKVITMYNYEYFKQQKTLNVLLEMGDVDLSSLLKSYSRRGKSLPYPIMIGYWTEMLSAVNHIHKNGIIHSDLKPANFLLVHGRLKLIDFGIASSLNVDATSVMKDSTMGTFNYLSPEAIASNGNVAAKISYKSDIWSLGCILYSMLYGKTPFSQFTHMYAKLAALANPNQKIEYPPLDGVPPILMRALRWCLTFDMKQRPSVQDLIDLPYLNCENAKSNYSCGQDVPMPIIAKIKSALSDSEWKIIANILDGARK